MSEKCEHLFTQGDTYGLERCAQCGKILREPVDVRALEDRVAALEKALRRLAGEFSLSQAEPPIEARRP